MEERSFLDYLGQMFVVFGITLLVIAVTCFVKGEDAREYSSMFALGAKGIPLGTVFEYLLSSACITFLRFLFFSDVLLKKMSIAKRTGGMLISVVAVIGVFAAAFGWFPVKEAKCWAAFLVCFAICFAVSLTVSVLRERRQNRKLARALEEWKGQQDEEKAPGGWQEGQNKDVPIRRMEGKNEKTGRRG